MELVVESGLEALTIARLAERLDCAVGALYRYFASKGDLLRALQEQAIAALADDLTAALAGARDPRRLSPSAAALLPLGVVCATYLTDAERAPARHHLIDASLSSPVPLLTDEQARGVDQRLAPLLGACAELIEAAVQAGALNPGDPRVRTHVLWAALHGLDQFRKRDRIQPPELRVRELAGALLQTTLVGWGAEPAAVAEMLARIDW